MVRYLWKNTLFFGVRRVIVYLFGHVGLAAGHVGIMIEG